MSLLEALRRKVNISLEKGAIANRQKKLPSGTRSCTCHKKVAKLHDPLSCFHWLRLNTLKEAALSWIR